MDDTKDDKQVASSNVPADVTASNSQVDEFLSLENLIKTYAEKVELLEKELKEKSQILKDTFESDAVYREHAQKAKEANQTKAITKQQLLKQPAMAEISERIKDLKFDIQESMVMMSDYLQQYQKQTGANQIEVGNGEVLEIVSVVKLVKKSSKNQSF